MYYLNFIKLPYWFFLRWMYKGNKEREARKIQEIKNTEMTQKSLDFKNNILTYSKLKQSKNTDITQKSSDLNSKLYDTSEKNGFENLAFETYEHTKN